MRTLKYSRQRESIEEFLKTRYDHPTADTVYQHVREEYPNISLGTVYRNLSLLASLGRLQIISCGDGVEHFDDDTSPHYHFRCNTCGCVLDVPLEVNQEINDMAARHLNCKVTRHSLIFEGYCSSCRSLDN